MVNRYLKLRSFVNAVIKNSPKHRKNIKYLLTDEEVSIANMILHVLQPFKEMTVYLSNIKTRNSEYLPNLFFLIKKLNPENKDSENLKSIKSLMLACLNFYIEKYNLFNNKFLIAATFLDPLKKDFHFVGNFSNKTAADFREMAKDFLINLNDEFGVKSSEKLPSKQKKSDCTSKKFNSIQDEYYSFIRPNNFNAKSQNLENSNTIQNEIVDYENIVINSKTDFSKFWLTYEIKFPKLVNLVRFVCCGSPTTTPSESDFSIGKTVVSDKRNKLSDKKMECLTFLIRNLEIDYSEVNWFLTVNIKNFISIYLFLLIQARQLIGNILPSIEIKK
jgi:hypothetical protein